MAYIRKTYDEYELEGYYYGSWEYILTAENFKDAKEQIKCYRENDSRPYRIVKHRIKKGEK
jgi:hypothetical protein